MLPGLPRPQRSQRTVAGVLATTVSSPAAAAASRANDRFKMASAELAVEIVSGADESKVGEGLREIAEQLPRRPDLLGEEPEVVAVGEHLLEGDARLVEPTRARERLDVPEGADRERAFVPRETIRRGGRVVPVDEAVGNELL